MQYLWQKMFGQRIPRIWIQSYNFKKKRAKFVFLPNNSLLFDSIAKMTAINGEENMIAYKTKKKTI